MSAILVVDDDPSIRRTLEILLRADGHRVRVAASGEAALAELARWPADVVLLDLRLPGIQGSEVLRTVRARHPSTEVVIITAYGSIESSVAAIKDGAFDYLTKPFTPEEVRHRIHQIDEFRRLRSQIEALRRRLGELPFEGELLTQNPATLEVLRVAQHVSATEAAILITGESGTGKTLLAGLVHAASTRAEGPLVRVDCAALHDTLLESELFGHRRGAYTGAVEDCQGKVELAQGGTLFLDEIGEIPLQLQGKLLRLVEERRFERLGDPTERAVDARIIASTNRDLELMVDEGAFRQDLFFRLNVVELELPPLRTRTEDVPLLAGLLVERLAAAHGCQVGGFANDAAAAMLRYRWPGNVRELINVVERAVLLARSPTIGLEDLPPRVASPTAEAGEQSDLATLEQVEEAHIRGALERGLPMEDTARLLGIDPSTLWRKRRRYGL